MTVRFYTTPGGSNPVRDYLEDLPDADLAAINDALLALQEEGLNAPGVILRHIGGKLWELKVGRHRVFYVVIQGPEVVLLHAYRKQGQKAPMHELETARRRLKEVLGNG
jgi:phage-related protein